MAKTYFSLKSGNFAQNWSDTGLITQNDEWSLVPSIVGYLGDGMVGSTGANPATVTGDSLNIDVIANQTSTSITNGGVAEFHIANPTVALQGSGNAGAPYLALYMDASGRENIVLTFNARDLDGTSDNAIQPLAVQYRIGDSGAWITVPSGSVSDATTGPSLATLVTPVTATLPAEANNQALLQIRILTTNAVGNDEWVGIDDILVTSTAASAIAPGTLSVGDASLLEGNEGASDLLFTVTRSGGSDGAVSASWSVSLDGTANSADLGSTLSGTVSFAAGQTSAVIRVPVLGDLLAEPNETFSVLLSAPTGGAAIGDGVGLGTIRNDDLPPVANVFINEFHYDNAGNDVGEFVELAGLAGTDLTGWKLVLYTGSTGSAYQTINLSGSLVGDTAGFGFSSVAAPGLQNGNTANDEPDGIALVDAYDRVVQFISYEGSFKATNGLAAGMISQDIGVFQSSAPIGTSLQLTGTGSSYGDFSWNYNLPSTAGTANAGQSFLSGTDQGQIRISDAAVVEGIAGATAITFTVSRAGGFASEASVGWTLDLGSSASADDFATGSPPSGTVTFAANEFTKTITLQVQGDTAGEDNEGFLVHLGNVTGNAAVIDGSGLGIILNDDPIARPSWRSRAKAISRPSSASRSSPQASSPRSTATAFTCRTRAATVIAAPRTASSSRPPPPRR